MTKIRVLAIAAKHNKANAKALSTDGRYFIWKKSGGWVEITKQTNNLAGRFKQACDVEGRSVIRGRIFIEVDQ